MVVSKGVAVQICLLVLDVTARAEEFKACNEGDVYVILASLHFGRRVARDAAAARQLCTTLNRKGIGRKGGLIQQLRSDAKQRRFDPELAEMSHADTVAAIIRRTARLPLW